MRSHPIAPADIAFAPSRGDATLLVPGDAPPRAPRFDDVYHATAGAAEQCRHVFISGNGLPDRWAHGDRQQPFVICEIGFGLASNALETAATWQADTAATRRPLTYIGIDAHPPTRAALVRAIAASPHRVLADALLAQWPPAVHGLHALTLAQGLNLLLAWGDASDWLSQLVAGVDAFYLDGFAPARNPAMWSPRIFAGMARLANVGATAATWSAAGSVRRGLEAAGFDTRKQAGFGGKREMTLARWRAPIGAQALRAPGRRPASAPSVAAAHAPERSALVVGAGIAGAACAQALAVRGWRVQVLEAAVPASGASGNPAGLVHGVVHADDGAHAQLLRAAALHAARNLSPLLAGGRARGALSGLLRLQAEGAPCPTLATSGYAQALSAAEARAASGTATPHAAWWFEHGGWVDPRSLVAAWLAHPRMVLRTQTRVVALRHAADGWLAVSASGQALARAEIAVVAAAAGSAGLLAPHTPLAQAAPWRLSRGQVTWWPQGAGAHGLAAAALPIPAIPLASGAYVLGDGERLLCGATREALAFADAADTASVDAPPGDAAHAHNIERAAALLGARLTAEQASALLAQAQGRVALRLAVSDRLPLLGPVPAPLPLASRYTQVRQIPRVPGLYVCTALGSRGLTLAPLLGEVLAAWVSGEPQRLASDVLDAIDPARVAARQAKKLTQADPAHG